ncbi:MAG TPA: helix-turn-helix transcriptional regulator, partial [Terriglobales bacterium]
MREHPSEGKILVGSFGERLRREREMRGISLDDIADATKIGTRLLRALEEEHFELLPGGIFNKGFVRAYAKYVGLNEEEAVADYLQAAGETVPDPRVIAEQNSSRIDRSGG